MGDNPADASDELNLLLYRSTYRSVRELLNLGSSPDDIRERLLKGVPDDPTDEVAQTKRAAVADALGGRPPNR